MTIGKTVFVFVCVYAPQANLSDSEKDRFYQELQSTVAKFPASEQLLVCGDWNGHLGSQSTGFEEVHGGQAIGKRNTEGERILEKKVQVGKDQEKAQSEKDSHSKNQGGKTPN